MVCRTAVSEVFPTEKAAERIDRRRPVWLGVVFSLIALAEFIGVIDYWLRLSFGTYLAMSCRYLAIGICCFLRLQSSGLRDIRLARLLPCLFFFNLITVVRGMYNSVDYWDWKFLLQNSAPALLTPWLIWLCGRLDWTQFLLRFILYWYLPLAFFICLFSVPQQYIYLAAPIYLFLLFCPYMQKRQVLIVLAIVSASVLVNYTGRSHLLRISTILILMSSINLMSVKLFRRALPTLSKLLFMLPIVLFLLAYTECFNIFQLREYISDSSLMSITNMSGENEDLLIDTRTFLYEDLLGSLRDDSALLTGLGATGKYHSDWYDRGFDTIGDGRGRYQCEVGILNIVLYSGLIGAILYGMIFFYASQVAICDSNNLLCKLLGLFVILRWNFFFVEEFTNLNTSYYMLWLSIGLCLTPAFRHLSDRQMRKWIQNI